MSDNRRSVTFTVLIFAGILIAILGTVILLFGLGGSSTFEMTLGSFKVKTTSVGLAVLAVGAGLSAGVALNLPEGVQVFGSTPVTMSARLRRLAIPFAAVAGVALVALAISVVV